MGNERELELIIRPVTSSHFLLSPCMPLGHDAGEGGKKIKTMKLKDRKKN